MASLEIDSKDWNAHFAARAEHELDELGELVRMESPSLDARAIGRVGAHCARELARAGGRISLVEGHANGPNLVARFGAGDRPVLLVGHMDTVWETGTLHTMPWRVEGGLAFGPGVFDMKAGLVVVMEAMRALGGADVPVTVVFNCDEEVGSASSRPLVEEEAGRARAVLVFEPPIPGGMAKTSRSGMADYRVRVSGVAAHAGVDPEKGVSAIAVAADLVARLHALSDYGHGLSVNVGRIAGGTRPNVIAAAAELHVDVRFRNQAQADAVDAAIRALEPSLPGASVSVEGGVDRPPFERTAATESLYVRAREAALASGFELGEGHVGGCSDGNFTAALGVPTLDGLGADGKGAHALHEQVVVADLPRRAAMLARLLVSLARA